MKTKKEHWGGLTRRDFLYLSGLGMTGIALTGGRELSQAAEKKPKYGGIIRHGPRYVGKGLDAHKNLV